MHVRVWRCSYLRSSGNFLFCLRSLVAAIMMLKPGSPLIIRISRRRLKEADVGSAMGGIECRVSRQHDDVDSFTSMNTSRLGILCV